MHDIIHLFWSRDSSEWRLAVCEEVAAAEESRFITTLPRVSSVCAQAFVCVRAGVCVSVR